MLAYTLKAYLRMSLRTSYRDHRSRPTRARTHRAEQVLFDEPREECSKRRAIVHRLARGARTRRIVARSFDSTNLVGIAPK